MQANPATGRTPLFDGEANAARSGFRNATRTVATLGPGDCLYLPAFWFHHVASTPLPPAAGDAPLGIAVSFWYQVSHTATRLLRHWLHTDYTNRADVLEAAIGSRFDEQVRRYPHPPLVF